MASASRARNASRGDLDGAEAAQMLGHELAIEQAKAALDQPRHEMDQRHLRGVALAAEHAFAEEGRAHRDAVEAADQPAVDPALDAVGVAAPVQLGVELDDRLVDPALGMAGSRLGAGAHGVGEGGIGAHLEAAGADRALQPLRQVEGVERQHRAQARIEPVELGVVAALAHREDADAVGLQQEVGRDLHRRISRRPHPEERSAGPRLEGWAAVVALPILRDARCARSSG